MLKIITEKGVFDHSADFSLQIDETSPIMNERGSQTVPATVPATPHNTLITGFPFRIDAANQPLGGLSRCTVADGVYRRRGVMNLVSASKRDGITFNIGFDNSEAYSKWKKRKLSDLSDLPVLSFDDMEAFSRYMNQVRIGNTAADFAIFQIMVEDDEKYPVYINQSPFHTDQWTAMRSIDGKDTEVTLPPGYGISGFLYVWRVVELVFADLGVTVVENPLKTDPELRRIVILNNCADACCIGELRYSDLMPSCTVEEFMNALRTRFGLVFNVDFNTMEAHLKLICDIVDHPPLRDLSTAIIGDMSVGFDNPKYIVLSAGTSIEGAAPCTERFEDFLKDADLSSVSSAPELKKALQTPLVYTTMTGEWFKWDKYNEEYESSGSSFFKWDPQTDGHDAEEMTSVDEFVPIRKKGSSDTVHYVPCYLVGASHHHSYIKGYKQESSDTPLAFLFAFIGVVNTSGGGTANFGSWSPALPNGENVRFADGSTHTLTLLFQFSNGLFARFWKRYDEILRHGFRSIEVPARMHIHEIAHLDTLHPVMMCGQRLLLDTYSYSLPAVGKTTVDLKLRTMRPIGTYDLDSEQNIPDFGPGVSVLQWQYESDNMQEAAYSIRNNVLDTYNMQHGTDCNVITLVRGYPSTAGFVTWQTDQELFGMQPAFDGEEVVRPYRCTVKFRIGKNDTEHPGEYSAPTTWVDTWTQTITYFVTLKGVVSS